MKKILITGVAGFIGFHIAEELLKHKKVKTAHILIGCGIISAAAIGGIALWFYDNFTILP